MSELQITESKQYKALYYEFKDLEESNWLMKWLLVLILIAGIGFMYLFFPTKIKERLVTAKFHGEFFDLVQRLSFEGIAMNRNFNGTFVFKKTGQSDTLVLVTDDGDSCTLMMPEKEFAFFKDDEDIELIETKIITSLSIRASRDDSEENVAADQQNEEDKKIDQEELVELAEPVESISESISSQTDELVNNSNNNNDGGK